MNEFGYYQQWHGKLVEALSERGSASRLARFLCQGREEAVAGYRTWISEIKHGACRPGAEMLLAISAWMEMDDAGASLEAAARESAGRKLSEALDAVRVK
jgi:hypothetical protein